VQLILVLGAGNIMRGQRQSWWPACEADELGMVGTVLNGMALRLALQALGMSVSVYSAMSVDFVPTFCRQRALDDLDQGRIVICTGGMGQPLFSTDTCAVLRAIELKAQVVWKSTQVDGLYSADPNTNAQAVFLPQISHQQAIERKLAVMDLTSLALARDHKMPVQIFSGESPLCDVYHNRCVSSWIGEYNV